MRRRAAVLLGLTQAALLLTGSRAALAHSFDERYDLPVPLTYFVVAAALVVALSFVVAAVFVQSSPPRRAMPCEILFGRWQSVANAGAWFCRAIALCLFGLAITSAFFGSGDPLMNFAPTLVWISWWVGLSFIAACVCNLWPVLDPWRTLFDLLDALVRRAGQREGIALHFSYPRALGRWPAVALLLLWSWLELVYPLASVPVRIGVAALAWSAFTLGGMVCFGRETWQKNADVFAVYFEVLGRFAPLAVRAARGGFIVRIPGTGLLNAQNAGADGVGFVIAMLSTVLYDGLRAGGAWGVVEAAFIRALPTLADTNGYVAGTLGLVGLWLAFLCAYRVACLGAAVLLRVQGLTAGDVARRYAWTLVPIAVGYNIAHNFSGLLIQGQNLIPLLSDPFALRWNIFGTAGMYPDIGLVDAKTTWYVAITAIVAGHVAAVWLAHRVALAMLGASRTAALACVPLTVLMVAYTALSLSVIAEPMVRFDPPPAAAAPVDAISWKAAPEKGFQVSMRVKGDL